MKRLRSIILLIGIVCLTAVAWWTLHPQPAPVQLVFEAGGSQQSTDNTSIDEGVEHEPAIDPVIFHAVLWHDPPSADDSKPAIEELPAPEPLRIQLVAIIGVNEVHQAAVYDERDDRIVIVTSGERMRDHEVFVTADAVEFVRDGLSQHLLLHPDRRRARGDGS